MNNIFLSYNNNLYIETIKNDINLQVPLNLEVINNIVNNYFNKTIHIRKQGLTKFIKTLINLHYSNITITDLRPLLLLGFKEIHPVLLTYSKQRLINSLINNYNNKHPDIILSEIVSSHSYNNRDAYTIKFREYVQDLFFNTNRREGFEGQDNMEPVYQVNGKYLLDLGTDNKTLHDNVSIMNIPNTIDVKSISSNEEEQFNYIKNVSTANALLNTVNSKLLNKSTDSNYLLLVSKYTKELLNNNDLLKKRKIPFNKFTKIIYESKNRNDITNITLINIINKIFFNEDLKKVSMTNDLSVLDEELFNMYKFNLLRSLKADDLRQILDIDKLLLKLIEVNVNSYLKLINTVNLLGLEHINFKEYESLDTELKQQLINRLSASEIVTYLLYNLDMTIINSTINETKLREQIIKYNN
jgi:hypothetical protein